MTWDYDCIGVGGLSYDLVLSVERLPLADEKYPAEMVGRLPGGFIANATCAAGRLGLRAAYAGWAGTDAEGDLLRDDFLRWNVDPVGLRCVAGEVTPFTVVITDNAGRRAILLPPFPLYHADLDSDQCALVRRARVILSFPRDAAWCAVLAAAARASGGLLALDVEKGAGLRGEALSTAMQQAAIVFITRSGAKTLGLPPLPDLVQPGQWIIMTAGGRGASGLEYGRRRAVFRRALDVTPVDTTGAGDCFHAALIAARLDGAALGEALDFANAAAAIKVQQRGARVGLPTRAEVTALLRGKASS